MQPKNLFTYPMDLLETPSGAQAARGANRFAVRSQHAADVLRLIIALSAEGVFLDDLLAEFSEPDRPAVTSLVESLVERKFAYYADNPSAEYGAESPQDLFIWHFSIGRDEFVSAMRDAEILLVGVNLVSINLRDVLLRAGVERISIVDDPLLRNVRLFDDTGTVEAFPELQAVMVPANELSDRYADGPEGGPLLVPCSDFGGHAAVRAWNQNAIELGWRMLPVVLSNLRGSIGPYVVPKASPCYECLIARQNANMDDVPEWRALDERAYEAQLTTAAYTDPMIVSLTGIAAMEITKIFGGLMLCPTGELIDISFLEPSIRRRPVLKIPGCPVCSSTEWRPAINISRDEFRKKLIANS